MAHYREKASYNWSNDSVRLIATPSQLTKSTFFYVEETGYFRTQPGYFTEREQLNSYLIVFTLAGKGFLTYRGKKYELKKNQAFFIHCMDYQYYETDSQDLWEFSWVHLNGAATSGYYQHFQSAGSPVVTINNPANCQKALEGLLEVHQNFTVHTEPLSSKLLTDLLTELLLAASTQKTQDNYIPETMKPIMRYIEKHFNEPISLDQLATRFNLSKFHLSREFKKYAGLSPIEFQISCRITYAKNTLKYSSQPIAAIAEEAGIPNTSHFINLFKDREGITPLAYRRKWQSPTW